ncbi:hypothetical protein IFR05_015646 [Cadophora sp. M221]|nr:hypothetical protein IFR05_015646 [Cadophora sp. M221]
MAECHMTFPADVSLLLILALMSYLRANSADVPVLKTCASFTSPTFKKAKGKSALDVRIARLRKLPGYKTPASIKIQAALDAYHDPDDIPGNRATAREATR